jgi:hypothetical protein
VWGIASSCCGRCFGNRENKILAIFTVFASHSHQFSLLFEWFDVHCIKTNTYVKNDNRENKETWNKSYKGAFF